MASLLDKTTRINLLYDHYGGLLTERQRRFVELHYVEDLSLGEIAEHFSISRQAVHDHLKRAIEQLEEYESVLGLVAKEDRRRRLVRRISEEVESLPLEEARKACLRRLIDQLAEDGEEAESGARAHPEWREGDRRHV